METHFEGERPVPERPKALPSEELEISPHSTDKALDVPLYLANDPIVAPESVLELSEDPDINGDVVVEVSDGEDDFETGTSEPGASSIVSLSRAALHTLASTAFTTMAVSGMAASQFGANTLFPAALALLSGTVAVLSWREYFKTRSQPES